MDIFKNLDLLSVGIAVAGIILLGFSIFFSDRRSVTNRTFLFFSITAAMWSLSNYFSYHITDLNLAIMLIRLVIFFAVWLVFFLFQLFYIFPASKASFPFWYKYIFFPLVILTSILNLTPLVVEEIDTLTESGSVATFTQGPGIFIFASIVVFSILGGMVFILKKTIRSVGEERKQYLYTLIGFLTSFLLLIIFNFILPAFLNNPNFIPLGALFIFPIIAFTSYAILKHRLFNIKVAGTALLVFALSVVTFAEIIFAQDLTLILFRSSIFLLVLIFGISLIRGVLREVSLREQLEIANEHQSDLLYFITHQIKGFLTNTKAALSMILEGDYGEVPENLKGVLKSVFDSESKGVNMVVNFLNASKIEKGVMEYKMEPFDMKQLIFDIIDDQKIAAEKRGLTIETNIINSNYTLIGDRTQLREALFNIIDNAVRYTPQGKITVGLERKGNDVTCSVKDSGVGITPEDHQKLFTKYGRGKDSRKINVDSNGIGLYTVKKIIEAHKGRIWAESEGQGKGSQFYIELPVSH